MLFRIKAADIDTIFSQFRIGGKDDIFSGPEGGFVVIEITHGPIEIHQASELLSFIIERPTIVGCVVTVRPGTNDLQRKIRTDIIRSINSILGSRELARYSPSFVFKP